MILRNLFLYARNNKSIFVLFMLIQITVAVAFFSVFNYAMNMLAQEKRTQVANRTYGVNLSDGKGIEQKMDRFSKKYGEQISDIFGLTVYKEETVLCEYQYTTGYDGLVIVNGKYFDKQDFQKGNKYAITVYHLEDNSLKNEEVGSTITFNNETYTVIGTSAADFTVVPFSSLKDKSIITQVNIIMKNNISNDTFLSDLREIFGTEDINLPPDYTFKTYYGTVSYILIFSFVVMVSVLNIAYLYSYIMNRRRRETAIFRICGCTFFRSAVQYLAEVATVSLCAYLIAVGVHFGAVMPLMGLATNTLRYNITLWQFRLSDNRDTLIHSCTEKKYICYSG